VRHVVPVIVVLMLAVVMPACSEGDPDCVDFSDRGDTLTIHIAGFEFQPPCFTVRTSQGIQVLNDDGAVHSFTLKGTPIDFDVPDEGRRNVGAVAGAVEPGTYDLICTYHPEMTGAVTVVK
jgi:plastocyanin